MRRYEAFYHPKHSTRETLKATLEGACAGIVILCILIGVLYASN